MNEEKSPFGNESITHLNEEELVTQLMEDNRKKAHKREIRRQQGIRHRERHHEAYNTYQREYAQQRAHTIKKVQIVLDRYVDRDIITLLDSVENKTDFIKELLRKHIEENM